MAVIEIAKIQVRRGQENQTGVPQLEAGEFGWAQDTEHLYIGKRISEGANTDENTRILTENDLQNIFNLVDTTSTQIINYTYREGVPYITNTVPISLQDRLDQRVSLASFGVTPSFDPVDITADFKAAIATLYDNFSNKEDSRRKLIIPAGHYYLSNKIELPPYASLEGEGVGLTTLTLISTGTNTNIFHTVDADGQDDLALMESGIKRAKNVSVSNMTLEYSSTASNKFALISLDNVLNATIDNIEFKTASTSTTSFFVSGGIGIQIRGTYGGSDDESRLCDNVHITNCKFTNLQVGIEGTGTITRFLIKDNLFSELEYGVKLFDTDEIFSPNKGIITNNKFTNIVNEGLFVGTATEATYHISQYNVYNQVGNGLYYTIDGPLARNDDFTTSTQTACVTFLSQGNKSIDDYFSRQVHAINTSSLDFYYNPLVVGAVSVINNNVYIDTMIPGVNNLTKVPLTGAEQRLEIEYKVYEVNHQYNRTGKLLLNLSKGGDVDFTFTCTTATVISTGSNILYINTASIEGFNIQELLDQSTTIRVTNTATPLGSTVLSVDSGTITISSLTTGSIERGDLITLTTYSAPYGIVSDYYNFSYEPNWDFGDPDEAVFLLSTPYNNYMTLTFTNWTSVNFAIEYQFSRNT